MKLARTLLGAGLAFGLGTAGTPAAAWFAEKPSVQQIQAEQPAREQLEAFAAATVAVLQIHQAALQQMETVEDPAQRAEVDAQAQARMAAAVEERGLTVEEYNQIAQLTQTDPALNEAVRQLIEEQLGG